MAQWCNAVANLAVSTLRASRAPAFVWGLGVLVVVDLLTVEQPVIVSGAAVIRRAVPGQEAREGRRRRIREGVRRVRQERRLPESERDDHRERRPRQGQGCEIRPRSDGLRDLRVLPDAGEPRRGLPHAQVGGRVQAFPPRMRLQSRSELRSRPLRRGGRGGQAARAARAVEAVCRH